MGEVVEAERSEPATEMKPKGSSQSAETDAASESRTSLLVVPSRKEEKPRLNHAAATDAPKSLEHPGPA